LTLTENDKRNRRETQKEIETGILKAIADMTEEDDWPEGADAFDVQTIITQLARSAAHLRENSSIESNKILNRKQ
jgi:hypothetical protein